MKCRNCNWPINEPSPCNRCYQWIYKQRAEAELALREEQQAHDRTREREANLVQGGLLDMRRAVNAERERDEARQVARTALDCTPGGYQEEQLVRDFPWLMEADDTA